MIYDIIPLIIILICFLGIIILYLKKLSYVASIDIEQLPKEQQAKVKKDLIEKRIENRIKNFNAKVKSILLPIGKLLADYYELIRGKIKKVEEEYKQKHLFLLKKQPEMAQQKIKELLGEGEVLLKNDELLEAEKKFIEIISLDPNNAEAYRSLGKLYLKQKNLEHAEETFKHVLNLIIKSRPWWEGLKKKDKTITISEINSQIASVYLDLADVYKVKNENEEALECYKKAVEIEPTSPKNLDFLIENAIIIKKKKIAEKSLNELKKVNPENEKIKEFELRIKELKN